MVRIKLTDIHICTVMPKNCDEIFQKNKMSKDGVYTIDADGTGPILEFQVNSLTKLGLKLTLSSIVFTDSVI